MPRSLVLVAHAETAATREAAFASDDGLNPRGLAAARSLRATLPRFDDAATSPAPAARESAAALGLDAPVDAALRDLDAGAWRGRSLADVAATDPDGLAAWIGDPAYAGHGGETIEALVHRMEDWLAATRDGRGVTIAVTHAATLRAALVTVLGAPGSAFWRIDVAPLTQLALSSDGRRWTLRGLRRDN